MSEWMSTGCVVLFTVTDVRKKNPVLFTRKSLLLTCYQKMSSMYIINMKSTSDCFLVLNQWLNDLFVQFFLTL